jgi:tRNA nucleotidyltransferase (CCA-adding enzyme)
MKIYLVGGAVRDKLLGYPHHESDWVVVGATPEEMLTQGFKAVGKDFPVFLHPRTNEEYALARTERKTAPGYRGFVCHSDPNVTLEEDLLRRDLTINAMAQDDDGTIIDPYGGRRDIDAKILRHVSPAFTEDPLRILRTARFAARYHHLGFRIAPETIALMRAMVDCGEVDALVPERVWKELQRALNERDPEQFFLTLQACGALARLMPELAEVSARTWQALQRATQQQAADTIRFGVLARELDSHQTQSLCERLKAPNAYRDMAMLVSERMSDLLRAATAGDALRLLDATDTWRRPERFTQWLQACALLDAPEPQLQRISNAFAAASRITAQQYLPQGLTGKALGAAIDQGRLQAIESIWKQP